MVYGLHALVGHRHLPLPEAPPSPGAAAAELPLASCPGKWGGGAAAGRGLPEGATSKHQTSEQTFPQRGGEVGGTRQLYLFTGAAEESPSKLPTRLTSFFGLGPSLFGGRAAAAEPAFHAPFATGLGPGLEIAGPTPGSPLPKGRAEAPGWKAPPGPRAAGSVCGSAPPGPSLDRLGSGDAPQKAPPWGCPFPLLPALTSPPPLWTVKPPQEKTPPLPSPPPQRAPTTPRSKGSSSGRRLARSRPSLARPPGAPGWSWPRSRGRQDPSRGGRSRRGGQAPRGAGAGRALRRGCPRTGLPGAPPRSRPRGRAGLGWASRGRAQAAAVSQWADPARGLCPKLSGRGRGLALTWPAPPGR